MYALRTYFYFLTVYIIPVILSNDTPTTHCFQTSVKSHIQLYEKPSSGQGFEEREIAG